MSVSPPPSPSLDELQPPSGPTKVCPHCSAIAQTFSKKCPHCGKRYKKHTVRNVLLGLIAFSVLAIGGCAALIGSAANEAVKQLDAEQQAHAITPAQFDAITLGASEASVQTSLGKPPEDRQQFQSKGFLTNEPANSSCIYYNRDGGSFGDRYQFCFDSGKLTSKNAY
jgi:hypothetical protein